jgi:ABC-2 type transport system ATP-binding protein
VERQAIRSRTDELLELMELHEQNKKLVVDYSHGMKKKLALSAALIHQPSLLFLDEPFEGIDAVASRQIKDLLVAMVGQGVTIFLTSHILEIVEKLCTHVAIIHNGRLIADGPLDRLRGIGEWESGVETKSLEQVFVSLVGGDRLEHGRLSWLE